MTADDTLDKRIDEMVASWPPLTDQQCDELARLLGPYGAATQ